MIQVPFFIIYLLLSARSLSELTMKWSRIPPLVRFSLQQAIRLRAGQFNERDFSKLLLGSVSVLICSVLHGMRFHYPFVSLVNSKVEWGGLSVRSTLYSEIKRLSPFLSAMSCWNIMCWY
jgi:hypothetical protein